MTAAPAPRYYLSDAWALDWSEITFEDGSGRGTYEDWLAAGGGLEAETAAKLVVVSHEFGYGPSHYLHRGEARKLPGLRNGLPLAGVWPVAWQSSDACTVLFEAVEDLVSRERLCLAACATLISTRWPDVGRRQELPTGC